MIYVMEHIYASYLVHIRTKRWRKQQLMVFFCSAKNVHMTAFRMKMISVVQSFEFSKNCRFQSLKYFLKREQLVWILLKT
jgi:hypothetical protein